MYMPEIQPMGFRAQIRELLSHEPVVLVPVTERNAPRFDATLTAFGTLAVTEDGMFNVTKKESESNAEWLTNVRGLWLFGAKEANLANPEQAVGFVNVYAPEHLDDINAMQAAKGKRPYEAGAVVELASFAKEYPHHMDEETSAIKQALSKVFLDDAFKDVRAVSVWVTHEAGNVLDPTQEAQLTGLGAIKLGALRYDASESVDSTAFIIPRKAFIDRLTAPKQ